MTKDEIGKTDEEDVAFLRNIIETRCMMTTTIDTFISQLNQTLKEKDIPIVISYALTIRIYGEELVVSYTKNSNPPEELVRIAIDKNLDLLSTIRYLSGMYDMLVLLTTKQT